MEALRLLISEAATRENGKTGGRKVIMVNDVSRAFFEAPARRPICVELLEEAKEEADWKSDNVAILEKGL